jgi:ATP-binding cassette subfamily B protein/subfamily B ATP-binding cassette protein MsbA
MMYFWKAIQLSFRYKWTIGLSLVNATVIAALWGATISVIYPFMEVVFDGKTMHTWVDDGLAKATAETKRLQTEMDGLRAGMERLEPPQRATRQSQIALREAQLSVQNEAIHLRQRLKPYVDRFAPTTAFGTLLLVIGFLIVGTIIKGFCLVLGVVLVARIAAGTIADMRRIFFRKMLQMDQRTIDRIGTTNLMTMLSHNVGLVQDGLSNLYGRSVVEPLKMLSCLIGAAIISWQLLLVSLFVAPVGFLLIHRLGRRMRTFSGREIEGYAAVFQTLLETVTGIKLVKIFTRERSERNRFKADARSLYKMGIRIALFDALLRPVTEMISIMILSLAMLCGAWLVLSQETHILGIRMCSQPLNAAQIFTFFGLLSGVADPGRKLTDIYNVIVRAIMASEMLFVTFDAPVQIAAPAHPKRAPRHSKSIRFENVTFGYDSNTPVIRDFNLEIPHGQTIALVGVNGCGKSTITNLLARFYDPDIGNVYLDDVNLRDMRPRQLRKQVGIVTQDPILFRGSVWSNIQYAKVHAPHEMIEHAARLASVTDFLSELPQGFQTQVGDRGAYLSGGQRQRVALARAILSDPRILILDEATSQLDVEAEARVHESLRDFIRQRTTIMITHRLSTLKLADRIVVMRAGQIIEDRPVSAVAAKWESFAELLMKAA